jgi:hypothetical protein
MPFWGKSDLLTSIDVYEIRPRSENRGLYKGTRFLTFKGSADGLHVENFRMPVLGYDPDPKPPADFQVFRARGRVQRAVTRETKSRHAVKRDG